MNNLPTRLPAPRPAASSPLRETERRPPPGDARRRGDEFERLLRRKSGAHDDDETAGQATLPLPFAAVPSAATAAAAVPLPAQVAKPAPGAAAGCAQEPSETAAKSSRQAALDGSASAATAGLHADAAQAFEVSFGDPRGVGLELRAQRPGGLQAAATPAPWSLTVGSGVVDASVLARHAPRLNERLQARAVTHAHVRIEDRHDGREHGGEDGARR